MDYGIVALSAPTSSSGALRNSGKQWPLSRDSFERVRAATLEPNSGTGDQILDRM